MPTAEPLTVTEAAESLGLPKRTLRHLLQRPDRRSRLLHAYRSTKKGLRTVEMVPADLLAEIRDTYQPSIDDASIDAALDADDDAGDAADTATDSEPVSVAADVVHADIEAASDTSDDRAGAAADQALVEQVTQAEVQHGTVSHQTGDAMMIVATYERLLAEKEARLADMRAALDFERDHAKRLHEALARAQESLPPQIAPPAAEAPASQPAESPAPPRRGFWARVFGP